MSRISVDSTTRLRAVQSVFPMQARVRYFSLLRNIQTVSGDHPASHSVSTGVHFRGKSGRGMTLTTHLSLVPRVALYLCSSYLTLWRGKGQLYPFLYKTPYITSEILAMSTQVTSYSFHVAASNAEKAMAKQCGNDEFENIWK
jgi:hypothetical protein